MSLPDQLTAPSEGGGLEALAVSAAGVGQISASLVAARSPRLVRV